MNKRIFHICSWKKDGKILRFKRGIVELITNRRGYTKAKCRSCGSKMSLNQLKKSLEGDSK